MLTKIKNIGKNFVKAIKNVFVKIECDLCVRGHRALAGTKAEAYVDSGVKILIAVVIGALLLAGLYFLFNNVIMPKVNTEVNDLFDQAPDVAGYAIGG